MSINKISCLVDFSTSSNNSILASEELRLKIVKDVESVLNKYELDYEIHSSGGAGGGGGMFWEIMKELFQTGDYLTLVSTFVSWLFVITKGRIESHIISRISSKKLKIILDMGLNYERLIVEEEVKLIPYRLASLKLVSDEIRNLVTDKYQVILVDQVFNINISKINYSSIYEIPAEKQNAFNSYRLMKLFENIDVRDGYRRKFSFVKYFLISRQDVFETSNENNTKIIQYFLFISSKVLADYKYKNLSLLPTG